MQIINETASQFNPQGRSNAITGWDLELCAVHEAVRLLDSSLLNAARAHAPSSSLQARRKCCPALSSRDEMGHKMQGAAADPTMAIEWPP